jgi:hypothetical protein
MPGIPPDPDDVYYWRTIGCLMLAVFTVGVGVGVCLMRFLAK